jgi:predicted DNA-binding transcriptional regulator YafY
MHYLAHWHLVAWCRLRGDFRDFRLDRIEGLVTLTEIFPVREGFQLGDYLERMRERHTGVKIRVKFSEPSAARARREWCLGLLGEEKAADGVVMTLATGELDWFVGWLLSFGTQATVLEPEELRQRLVTAAEMAAMHHKNGAAKSLLT